VKVEDVSKELGVRYVLEGSVRKAGNQVRITAQLIDATTGGHLWAERYDRELKEIFALQDEIRRKIVAYLAVRLTEEEQEHVWSQYTANLEAYDSSLRGVEYWWRATKEANVQARQMFEKAIELDPTYAVAYSWLGQTYYIEWAFQWSQDPRALERAFELAQRAIALDDSLPAAHLLLGGVYLWKHQHDQAIAEAEQAIALAPNWVQSYADLATILTFAGRPEEAIGLAEKALRFDPRNLYYYLVQLGNAYRFAGRYKEAIAAHQRALNLNPNILAPHIALAAIYSETGREEEARAEVAELLRINPNFSVEGLRLRNPYKDPAALERTLAALREAGLK
jgi:adenylate cyclase